MKTVLYLDMWVGERIQEMKLAGIRRFAAMRDWTVVVKSERESRPRNLARLLKRERPIGCIVECSAGRRDLLPELFGDVPVVYLDCSRSMFGNQVAKVVHDGKQTVRTAFRELASNHPSSYAVVGYRDMRSWSTLRERAFKTLVKESGSVCEVFGCQVESAAKRACRLSKWVARLPPRCAVFAVNDDTAAEVLSACAKAGRRIPADMTLLGVDNVEGVCESSIPRLSSIQVDSELAGYHAAKLLDEKVHLGAAAKPLATYGPMLTVRRESTRGFGRAEPRILSAMELIRREACNGLTAADVAKLFAGSRRLVEIRFRETLGHSILDEIQNVRMEKVQFLLSKTDTPIGAIAAQCGYRSDIALRKAFRLLTGKSLADWRKANRAIMVFPHPPASGGGFPRPRPV